MTLAELRAKYTAKIAEARAAIKNGVTAEARTRYDAIMAEAQDIQTDVARLVQLEEAEARENDRLAAEERARAAGRPTLPNPTNGQGSEERSAEDAAQLEQRNRQYMRAYNHYLRTRDDSQLRAMNSTTGANGGYAIPVLTNPDLERAILTFGGVAPYLDQLTTDSGEQINWPMNNDTANSGREISENTDATETDITLSTAALTVGLFSTDSVLIPRTLLQDSAFDLASRVTAILGERQARLLSSKIIGGSTGSSFDSLVSTATVGSTSASPTAIGLTDISTLVGAVDPGYAKDGKFVMNRATQLYLSVQRTNGLPVFPLDANGLVSKLFGQDIVIDQNMASIGATNITVLFGNLKKYILRKVGTMEVMRLDERYATANQVAFLGFWRAGGKLIDAGTHPIQALKQHA